MESWSRQQNVEFIPFTNNGELILRQPDRGNLEKLRNMWPKCPPNGGFQTYLSTNINQISLKNADP